MQCCPSQTLESDTSNIKLSYTSITIELGSLHGIESEPQIWIWIEFEKCLNTSRADETCLDVESFYNAKRKLVTKPEQFNYNICWTYMDFPPIRVRVTQTVIAAVRDLGSNMMHCKVGMKKNVKSNMTWAKQTRSLGERERK